MAKKRYRRSKNKAVDWLWMLLVVLGALAVGGLFTSGTTLSFPILEWIPEIVHTIVGWVIIGGTLLGVLLRILKVLR